MSKKPFVHRVLIPKFYDADLNPPENGNHIYDENVLAAIGQFRQSFENDGFLLVSTRAQDQDGDWHNGMGLIKLDNIEEDGSEIIIDGANGDRFKLVVSRALRTGIDPKASVILEDIPATTPSVGITDLSEQNIATRLEQIEQEIATLKKEKEKLTKVYPGPPSFITKLYDTDRNKENGDRCIQYKDLDSTLKAWDNIDIEPDNLLISTRGKDKDGKWHTSTALTGLRTLEDGSEFILNGYENDKLKLTISKYITNEQKEHLNKCDERAKIDYDKYDAMIDQKSNPTSPLLMAVGLLGGAIFAGLNKNTETVRVENITEPNSEDVADDETERSV